MVLPTSRAVDDPNHVPDHNVMAAEINQAVSTAMLAEVTTNKNVAGGYAGLDASGYVQGLIPSAVQAGAPALITGATAAARFAGGTVTGPPVSGTFVVGDFIIAQNGFIYICTVAGTPGTWTLPGTAVDLGAYLLP